MDVHGKWAWLYCNCGRESLLHKHEKRNERKKNSQISLHQQLDNMMNATGNSVGPFPNPPNEMDYYINHATCYPPVVRTKKRNPFIILALKKEERKANF